MTRQETVLTAMWCVRFSVLLGEGCWWSREKWRKAMKKMRLAAAALVLGSCITLGAAPANANTTEPVTNQAPISTVQGNETNGGFGCIARLWFGWRAWCNYW